MRVRQITAIIKAVESISGEDGEFSSTLWAALVDRVTVYGKDDVRFTLANGTEIRA